VFTATCLLAFSAILNKVYKQRGADTSNGVITQYSEILFSFRHKN